MSTIHDADLPDIDLNLLAAFDVLARVRSVTRAAEKTGVTQSAMSHTLRRLRNHFDDPLFLRGRGGLVLTPRADALVIPVRSGLLMLGRAIDAPEAFDPATAQRRLRIASPDLFDVLALPLLLDRIATDAPGVDLSILTPAIRHLEQDLETGDVDIAVMALPVARDSDAIPELTGAGLVRRTLFHDTFSCFLRRKNPVFKTRSGSFPKRPRLSLAAYVSMRHAMVSPTGEGAGIVDRLLHERGLTRRVALRVPTFYAAPAIIAQSDLVLTAPTALRRALASGSPVVRVASPLPLPEHAVAMVWHERFSADPGHRWLRDLLASITKSMGSGRGSGAKRVSQQM